MAFVLLPLSVGDDILATQFNEARDSVEERSHTVGNTTALPNAVVGATLTAVSPTAYINDLRQRIEDMVIAPSTVHLKWVNPNSDDEYFDLAEFFTAASIGDFNNWTRVPARKGGLTVSSRLVQGDTIFVEHINEIRLAVLELGRVRWTMPVGDLDLTKEARKIGVVGPSAGGAAIWPATRDGAIAAAIGATPTGEASVGFTLFGFVGTGEATNTPTRKADVFLGHEYPESNTPLVGSSAPKPATYANVRLEMELNFTIFNFTPRPTSITDLVEVRIVSPQSALTFPPTAASWHEGTQWATVDLSNGTKIVASLDASQLPDLNPDTDFSLIVGVTDEGVGAMPRQAWPDPIPPGGPTEGSESRQVGRVVSPMFVDADITNFSFQ